ncbi:MAG: hypothetical protein AAF740_08435, partial [Bacteroidota bacterium]
MDGYRAFAGDLGHFFVIASFVTSIVAAVGYFFATKAKGGDQQYWKTYARRAFFLHAFSILSVVGVLFSIIY